MSRFFASCALLIAGLLLDASSARADLIDILGPVVLNPTALGFSDIRGAATHNGTLYVVGRDQQRGVAQSVDLSTGTVSGLMYATSLAGASNNAGSVDAVASTPFGLVFGGDSANPLSNFAAPTLWFDLGTPILADSNLFSLEGIRSISATGLYTTGPNGAAFGSVANPGGGLVPLQNGLSGSAFDISSNGQFVAGSTGLWQILDPVAGTSVQINTSAFATPVNGSVPNTFLGVVSDPTAGTYAFSEGYDFSVDRSYTAGWNVATGELVFQSEFSEGFMDARFVSGELVVGTNGLDGGRLYSVFDPSNLLVKDLLGLSGINPILFPDSFYDGSFGFVSRGPTGEVFTASVATAVPEPSSYVLLGSVAVLFTVVRCNGKLS